MDHPPPVLVDGPLPALVVDGPPPELVVDGRVGPPLVPVVDG